MAPPAHWLAPLETPVAQGDTNLDLLRESDARGDVIRECNIRLRRLREWRDQYAEGEP